MQGLIENQEFGEAAIAGQGSPTHCMSRRPVPGIHQECGRDSKRLSGLRYVGNVGLNKRILFIFVQRQAKQTKLNKKSRYLNSMPTT